MFFKGNNLVKKTLTLKMPGAGVDFHMHTTASDGAWSPQGLVDTAAAEGLKVFAVTDHDTIKSMRTVQSLAAQRGMQVIPGVEITINWRQAMYHMLVFNFDPDDTGLNRLLDDTEAQLAAKRQALLDGAARRGYKLVRLDDFKRSDGTFNPIDVARALHRGGEITTFDQAIKFCRQHGLDRICSQPADEAIRVALAAGGIPVIAHPGRQEYGFTVATTETLRELVEVGLAGIEVYHYSHGPAEINRYLEFARQHGLAISAGSDSHGENRKPTPWNPELAAALLERFDLEQPAA